ncbi:MAG TPA: nitronate monooxygenase, partial [Ignavibacteriaceae bacterium]|nr:nitronate monooxygenase [Ignavibacteriaceae bacterium]
TLAFKKIGLVRIIKNDFAFRAIKAEKEVWNELQLRELLSTKRERSGIFEGDLIEGELEAGQGVGLINDIPSVKDLFVRLLGEYEQANYRIKK